MLTDRIRMFSVDRAVIEGLAARETPPPLGPERGLAHFVATVRRCLPHVHLATHSNPE